MKSVENLLIFVILVIVAIAVIVFYYRKRRWHTQLKQIDELEPATLADQPSTALGAQPTAPKDTVVQRETSLEEGTELESERKPQPLRTDETQPMALPDRTDFTKVQEAQPVTEEVQCTAERETQETVMIEGQPATMEEIQTLPAEKIQPVATGGIESIETRQAEFQETEEVQAQGIEELEGAKRRQRKPVERGGRPRGTITQSIVRTQKTETCHSNFEIICWKRARKWILAVETSEEFLENFDVAVFQNGYALSRDELEESRWRLERIDGNVITCWDEAEAVREIGQKGYLMFKLSGQNLDMGRLVKSPSSGLYLVVVPDTWKRDRALSGPAPVTSEPVSIVGYKAHFFDLDKSGDRKIAFRLPNGQPLVIESKAPRFELIGRQLTDANERMGPLFGESPPRVRALDAQIWKDVATIVVGEEGSGRGRWRMAFDPDPYETEQELPPEVASKKGGWYFLRFYDTNGDLIESLDFRFINGLKEIRSSELPPLPSEGGHGLAHVEFFHASGCTVRPASSFTNIQIEHKEGKTILTVPPDPTCDLSRWLVFPDGGSSVEVAVLVERIWWALAEENSPPSQWTDEPIALSREDFAATSNKALWLRLPKCRWADNVLAGFDKHEARQISAKVTEETIAIPLRNFGDAQELSNIGTVSFYIWVDSYQAAVADVTVKSGCGFCDFLSSREEDVLSHIESVHLKELFSSLTWDEMRKHDRSLPPAIYKCSYCDFYIASNDPRNPTSSIENHIVKECTKVLRKKGPVTISFKVIDDISEIRENVIKNLPNVYKCNLCDARIEGTSLQVRMQHLVEQHRGRLYSLH